MEIKYLSVLGLLLIAVSWLLQFRHLSKGKREIIKSFVALNSLGIVLLIVDAFIAGSLDIAVMNVVTLACSLLVLASVGKGK